MSAPAGQAGPPDAQLVAGTLAGDRAAFATVYDRYGDKLYDFCWSMLRQREEAADAVADTFVLFAERLFQLRDPDRLRPWLYAIARSECLRRLKARGRYADDGENELITMADPALGPEHEAEQAALRDLVWSAAEGLADRDRALLDLHLRQGLEGAELGEAMGVSANNAYVMLNRLRAQVERSLGALLIARLGRKDCTELDEVLGDWDGRFSPLIRKRVARHVDNCDVCSDRRKKIVSPWALLASVPAVTAPLWLRDRVVNETQLAAASQPLDESQWTDPPPPPPSGGFWTSSKILVAAAVVAVLAIGSIVLLWPGGSDDEPSAVQTPVTTTPGPPSVAPPPAPPSSSAPPTSAAPQQPAALTPGALSVSTRAVDLGADGVSSSVTLTNTGDSEVQFSVASGDPWLSVTPGGGGLPGDRSATVLVRADRNVLPEGQVRGGFVITWDRGSIPVTVSLTEERPPLIGLPSPGASTCGPGGRSVVVTASVSDDTGLGPVTLSWTTPAGTFSGAMSPSGGAWVANAGPFPVGGSVSFRVTATDNRGNTATGPATTVHIDPCPQ